MKVCQNVLRKIHLSPCRWHLLFIYLEFLDSLFLAMDEVGGEHLTKQKAKPPFITLKQFMD